MITFAKSGGTGNYDRRSFINCLSTDEKPTAGIKNGSVLIEIDTGTLYLFDEESKNWINPDA